jgi:hypothetical protein
VTVTFRIYSLCVICAVAALALFTMGAAAPKPTVSSHAGTGGWAPDSSVAYRAQVSLSGPLGKNDLIRYTKYRDNVLVGEARTRATDTTFAFVAPAYDSTSAYRLCARVFRGDSASGGFKCAEQAFTRGPAPEEPPPVVDSIVVSPAQVSLTAGKTQQFQAVVFSR